LATETKDQSSITTWPDVIMSEAMDHQAH